MGVFSTHFVTQNSILAPKIMGVWNYQLLKLWFLQGTETLCHLSVTGIKKWFCNVWFFCINEACVNCGKEKATTLTWLLTALSKLSNFWWKQKEMCFQVSSDSDLSYLLITFMYNSKFDEIHEKQLILGWVSLR